MIQLQEIFLFRQTGVGEDGRVLGEFKATGVHPRASERLTRAGYDLDPLLFAAGRR